jgi:hypothetical protein
VGPGQGPPIATSSRAHIGWVNTHCPRWQRRWRDGPPRVVPSVLLDRIIRLSQAAYQTIGVTNMNRSAPNGPGMGTRVKVVVAATGAGVKITMGALAVAFKR